MRGTNIQHTLHPVAAGLARGSDLPGADAGKPCCYGRMRDTNLQHTPHPVAAGLARGSDLPGAPAGKPDCYEACSQPGGERFQLFIAMLQRGM